MSARILVIDDDPISRRLLRATLQAEGYDVSEAPDGRSAVELARRRDPALVIQDLRLPDMTTPDLVRQLRQVLGERPILALTGYSDHLDQARGEALGFADYLVKPVSPTALVGVVESHLGRDAVPSAEPVGSVLVVDDDPANRLLIGEALSSEGFRVFEATSGSEGLTVAADIRPDVILSDVVMQPQMDGFRFVRAVRADPTIRHIPVVLVSDVFDDHSGPRLARASGATAFVPRGLDTRPIVEALLAALSADAHHPPTEASEGEQALMAQVERLAEENRRLLRLNRLYSAQLSMLAGAAETLARAENVDGVLDEILARYMQMHGFTRGALYVRTWDEQLELRAHHGFAGPPPGGALLQGELRQAATAQRAVVAGDVISTTPERPVGIEELFACETIVLVPLVLAAEAVGVVILGATSAVDTTMVALAKAIQGQVGQAIALGRTVGLLRESEERLLELATHDELTSLPNRRYFREELGHHIERVRRYGGRLAVCYLDLNGFKALNDSVGHEAGDRALMHVGEVLRSRLRDSDIGARLGGDEFAFVLLDATAEQAGEVCRDVGRMIAAWEPQLGITASIGYAVYPDHADDAQSLLRHADQAMYRAKESSPRGEVCAAGDRAATG